jgi:hypothetical protein
VGSTDFVESVWLKREIERVEKMEVRIPLVIQVNFCD